MLKIRTWRLLIVLVPGISWAQRIDNIASFNNIESNSFFRFHYDNDFFNATDRYYSQGINIELVHPSIKKIPLTNVLLPLKSSSMKYGMSVEHDAFTPSSIRHDEIIYNDRPFAACIMLKIFSISSDTVFHARLSSVISIGAIGPAAFGEGMQKTIHHALKNIQPLGWQNQIQNDVIVNYEIDYEKLLYNAANILYVNSNAQIRLGTLNDKAQAGFTFITGKPGSVFERMRGNGIHFYFYAQPIFNLIAFDATLQGGLFNRKGPYTISPENISRVSFQNNAGIVFAGKKIFLEYYQSFLTKEFKTGKQHRWGGLKIGFNI